eukprot:3548420-Prymnesium_polylepis.1
MPARCMKQVPLRAWEAPASTSLRRHPIVLQVTFLCSSMTAPSALSAFPGHVPLPHARQADWHTPPARLGRDRRMEPKRRAGRRMARNT